jgi:hypothetical protein
MADPPSYPHAGDDSDVTRDRAAITGTPRWVRVVGIVALVVVLVFVILMVVGDPGAHGPGRHMFSAHSAGQTLPSDVRG